MVNNTLNNLYRSLYQIITLLFQVFYGGKSFTAAQPVKSNKIKQKDDQRLGGLGSLPKSEPVEQKKGETTYAARTKNLLKMLSEKPVNK